MRDSAAMATGILVRLSNARYLLARVNRILQGSLPRESIAADSTRISSPLRGSQRKHEQHSTPARVAREVRKRRAALPDVERQVGGHISSNEQSHIAADARIHGHVLLAVGPGVGHRRADHAGT